MAQHEREPAIGAVVFPGQGSQRVGMALDFFDSYAESRAVFETAESVLPFSPISLCKTDDGRLDLTEYAQPCILTAEIAMYRALQAHASLSPLYFAGHSLGEYTALVAAGAIPFHAALQLVHRRGQLMQQATPLGVGAMCALIMAEGLPANQLRGLAREHDIDIANDNSPEQMVLSGKNSDLTRLSERLAARFPTMRIVPLTVSAPFHSRHMSSIQERFEQELMSTADHFNAKNATCVTSNASGGFHTGKLSDLIQSLTVQLDSSVLWQENMSALLWACKHEASGIVELGPGRPLRRFFKAIGHTVPAIVDLRSARRVFPNLEPAQS